MMVAVNMVLVRFEIHHYPVIPKTTGLETGEKLLSDLYLSFGFLFSGLL